MRGPPEMQPVTDDPDEPRGGSVRAGSSSVVARVATESHTATGVPLPSFSRNGATIKTMATA
jgi:hypothetical protein